MKDLKRFICEEEAMGTVEVVLIVAVLIGIGLLFKNAVIEFVTKHLGQMEGVEVDIDNISPNDVDVKVDSTVKE